MQRLEILRAGRPDRRRPAPAYPNVVWSTLRTAVASNPAVVTVRLPRSEDGSAERTGWTAPNLPAVSLVEADDDPQGRGSPRRYGAAR